MPRRTKEEQNKNDAKLVELLNEGLSLSEIAKKLGYSCRQAVSARKQLLIKSKKIKKPKVYYKLIVDSK